MPDNEIVEIGLPVARLAYGERVVYQFEIPCSSRRTIVRLVLPGQPAVQADQPAPYRAR